MKVQGEAKNLRTLVDYCKNQNDSGRIPHILIVDYPDYEIIACMHSPKYNGQNVQRFITSEFNYPDIDKFKADEKIYYLLNNGENSYNIMLLKVNSSTSVIHNVLTMNKSKYEINVRLKYIEDNLGIRGSNISDLFEVLRTFENSI